MFEKSGGFCGASHLPLAGVLVLLLVIKQRQVGMWTSCLHDQELKYYVFVVRCFRIPVDLRWLRGCMKTSGCGVLDSSALGSLVALVSEASTPLYCRPALLFLQG